MSLIKRSLILVVMGLLLLVNHPIRAQGAVIDQTDSQISFEIKEESKDEPKKEPNDQPKQEPNKPSEEQPKAGPKGEGGKASNAGGSRTYSGKNDRVLPKTGEQESQYPVFGWLLLLFSGFGYGWMRKKGCHEKIQK